MRRFSAASPFLLQALEVRVEDALRASRGEACFRLRRQEGVLAGVLRHQGDELRPEDVGDDRQADDRAVRVLGLDLALAGDALGELGVHLGVDQGAQGRIAEAVAEAVGEAVGEAALLRQVQVLHGEVEHRLEQAELLEQGHGDVDGAGLGVALLTPGVLDRLDVLTFLHLACETLLVRGGEEEDLADLAQVHADRVVDALLVLEGGAGRCGLALLFGVRRRLDVGLRPDVGGAEGPRPVLEHVGYAAVGIVAGGRVAGRERACSAALGRAFN